MTNRWLLSVVVGSILCGSLGIAKEPDQARRVEFVRMAAHWSDYGDPAYLEFLSDAKIEIAQVGFYGAHFWSLGNTELGKGYPMNLPCVGLGECGAFFENLNREIHKRGAKVVGHFNVEFLVGDPESAEGPRGFFKFYRELWDEKQLGPKPVADPLELLQKDAAGKPIVANNYTIGGMKEYWGCLNNPHWRTVLKAWIKVGIERGVDGFIANYFYRHNCLCTHCVSGFQTYLDERFTAAELKEKFAIENLATHGFPELVAWHDPKESTPLRREMLRFSQISTKAAFDDVFIQYGRSLKPGLLAAQWNHLGFFSHLNGDERCLLPAELWGKGEDYLWYSTGDGANRTDLAAGDLGEVTLQARYIRGAFEDKPFTFGKYESTRTRVAIAELAANGGAPMGFYTSFKDPLARAEIVRYYQFLAKHDAIYRANRPYAEEILWYPRTKAHQGDITAIDEFKKKGKELLEAHVLFEVRPDDLAPTSHKPATHYPARQRRDRSGTLTRRADDSAPASPVSDTGEATNPIPSPAPFAGSRVGRDAARRSSGNGQGEGVGPRSKFDAPTTVRVSATRPPQNEHEIDLHFVNYNRTEPAEKRSAGTGIKDELPIVVSGVKVDFVVPQGKRVRRITFLTPESEKPVVLKFAMERGRVGFTLPEFLVYGVARLEMRR